MDMGLGKTVTTLTALVELLLTDASVHKVLVIAPKKVVHNVWPVEVAKWDHTQHLSVGLLTGTANQRVELLKRRFDLYVISRDLVTWLVDHYQSSWPFDTVVIDELSSFKSSNSQRFRALRRKRPRINRVIGLTGTPAPNSLMDLWPQLYLLDRGERLEDGIGKFRELYFISKDRRYHLKSGAEEKIHQRISDICVSMSAKDYLELPELIEQEVVFELTEKTMKAYQDFERDQVMELLKEGIDEVTITAVNATVLTNKLLQFASGMVYDELKVAHKVHDEKLEVLAEYLESNQDALIIYNFRSNLVRIQQEFGARLLDTPQDIIDWNEGRINRATMHPQSGGHGLNLQGGGDMIIWYDQTWSLELEQQVRARLHRQGRVKPVLLLKLIAKGTMDEEVIRVQKRKDKQQQGLLDAVKAKIKHYKRNT
jgi:SNF2 family DNA or RNA helicase